MSFKTRTLKDISTNNFYPKPLHIISYNNKIAFGTFIGLLLLLTPKCKINMKQATLLSIFFSLFFLPYLNAQCPDIEAEITQQCSMDSSEITLYIDISNQDHPYNIEWQGEGNSGQETFPFSDFQISLPYSPDYLIRIEDDNGCVDTIYYESSPLVTTYNVGIGSTNNASCSQCNGSVEIFANGGNPPYLIQDANGTIGSFNDTVVISDLCAGSYEFILFDSLYCYQFIEVNIEETISSDPIYVEPTVVSNTICNGCNGAINLSVSGGHPPYAITPGGQGETFADNFFIDNLCPGTYEYEITDSLGCENVFSFIIDAIVSIPEISIIHQQPNTCMNDPDGLIVVLDTGIGTTYYWESSNGFSATTTVPTISNLSDGQYFLAVTSLDGCTNLINFEIELLQTDVLLETSHTNATCTSSGTIAFDLIEGEDGPYTNTITDENGAYYTNNDLPNGIYYACVTDINGCLKKCDTIVIINEDFPLELNSSYASCENSDGLVTATIADSIITPTFEWSNGQTGDTLLDVVAGWYSVTVTDDARDCQTHQNVEVKLDPSCYVQISGYVYLDSEVADCVKDSTTIPAEYVLVELSNGSMDYTDEDGYYEFQEEAGSYEVIFNLENTIYDPVCADPIMVAVSNSGDKSENNNFWLKYREVQDLAVQIFTSAARPGFDQTVTAYVFNLGNAPTDGTIYFTHDSLQNFITSVPSGYTYDESSSTISWELGEIQPGTFERFDLRLNLPANTPLGTFLNYRLTADPIFSDANPLNNIVERQLIVTGSYDPNDKQVSPAGEGEEGSITRADSILTYQVRFQNTGTDTAFTVVVLDEIDEDLDITSVRPGPSSHPYKLNVLDGNVLEFRFENIMLPDSFVNEPASNGYVLFDIKTKKDLPWGSKIENTAAIYFDFNEPIITNTTINTLVSPVNVNEVIAKDLPLSISPNPGGDLSILKFSLEEATEVDLALYDTRGHLITQYLKSENLQSGAHQIRFEESDLPQGIYFVILKTADGMMGMEKWVKVE